MRVMSSNRLTIILDDKTDVTGFETEQNEESMEHAQAFGSILCGCVKGRGTDDVYVECVFAKKSFLCAHFVQAV